MSGSRSSPRTAMRRERRSASWYLRLCPTFTDAADPIASLRTAHAATIRRTSPTCVAPAGVAAPCVASAAAAAASRASSAAAARSASSAVSG